jgi:hypothetical protein
MMVAAVFLLCVLTSGACALLCARMWWTSPSPLLLGSAICFAGLMLNNLLMAVTFSTSWDLSSAAKLPAVAGLLVLAGANIWSSR